MNDRADRRKLLAEWDDLLTRREPFRGSLGLYQRILALWAEWDRGGEARLQKDEAWCRARWEKGIPLLLDEEIPISREAVEPFLSAAIELLYDIREEDGPGLARLAEAWDRGELSPALLLPGHPSLAGGLQQRIGLSSDLVGVLSQVVLRPALEDLVEPLRRLVEDVRWNRGVCPFCGSPAAFSDFGEDGKRRLLCHLCGSDWGFVRIRCPSCDNRDPNTLKIFSPEEEEGYLVEACDVCRGYIKGLDRRLRWNVVSSLLEDWGSPHLDLIALAKGYWRSSPTLVLLAQD